MKKVFVSAAIAALMCTGAFLSKSLTPQNDGLSDIQLANAEALADGESPRRYAERTTHEMEIWDEESESYQKMIYTICTGKGELVC